MTLENTELTVEVPHLAPWQVVALRVQLELGLGWHLGFQTSPLWVCAAANVLICPSVIFKLGRQSNRCILKQFRQVVSISKCKQHLSKGLILKRFSHTRTHTLSLIHS